VLDSIDRSSRKARGASRADETSRRRSRPGGEPLLRRRPDGERPESEETAAIRRELRRAEADLARSRRRVARLTAAERRVRGERLAALGVLAAGIAHEINNPINTILLTAESSLSTEDAAQLPRRLQEDLEIIAAEAQRCGEIVGRIFDFAIDEHHARTLEDLNELVQAAIDATAGARRRGVEVTTRLAPGLPPVSVDRTEIEQVVVDLLTNAGQSSAGGVRIGVATELRGDRVRVVVADDGGGIPEGLEERVFDPFFTTRREHGSTGLGLSLAHHFVTEHGGSLEVDSDPGHGAVFTVELPAAGAVDDAHTDR
jgi:signal transduction histidine kinase